MRLLTPKQKLRGLVASVTRVQTKNPHQVFPHYSQSPFARNSSHLQDLCKTAFLTDKDSSLSKAVIPGRSSLDFDKSNNSANVAIRTNDNDGKQEKTSVEDRQKCQKYVTSPVVPEVSVQEVFNAQVVTPLKLTIPAPEKQEQQKTNSWCRRQHTSSSSSSNSAEEFINAQSRCSVCDGCSSNTSGSPSAGGMLGLGDDLHTTAGWTYKSPEPTRYLIAQMQEDISVLFDSVDAVDQQLHQPFCDLATGKEV